MADGENSILHDAKEETDSEKRPVDSFLEGAGAIQDTYGGIEKLAQGDWTEGLLSLGSAGFDAASLIASGGNPLETLLSWGLGWVIEHVDFLKEPLDWLTGNQDALDLEAQKWTAISKKVQETAEQLTAEVRKNTVDWTGAVADRYLEYVQEQLHSYRALSDAARDAGAVVEVCKIILDVVRTVIRDLITDTLAKIIFILMRYPPPGYPAALAAEGVPFAIKKAGESLTWVQKLQRAFANAIALLKKLDVVFVDLVKKWAKDGGKYVADVVSHVGGVAMHAGLDTLGGVGKAAVKEVAKGALDYGASTENSESADDEKEDEEKTTIDPNKSGVVGKGAAPASSEVRQEEKPIFGQQGGQRISGSL
ncbi:WXG100 family type VII secretion target [Amycolatopsis sp. w19]|uniref:WXG100 family type VII secretion target n=1 Tax=Amycolatopsis sp. w19 TaxID=3448134 RepID=UPI003F196082